MYQFDFNKITFVSATYDPMISSSVRGEVEYNLDQQIEYLARISNPSAKKIGDGKLTQYLIKHKHWSPLEMVDVTFQIETTRDIARQILRHRSANFQEFSQRYANINLTEIEDENPLVIRDARSQDGKNRQSSHDNMSPEDKEWWNIVQKSIAKNTIDVYNQAIERGIAKECARVILPEGMTPSKIYMKTNVRNWYHYVGLRSDNGTQLEHRDIANKINKELTKLMPNIFNSNQ